MRIELSKELVANIDKRAKWNNLTREQYLYWVFTGKEPEKDSQQK